MSELVSGEAVVLELRLAKLASRAVAFTLDAVVMVTVFLAALLGLVGTLVDVDDALGATLALVLALLVFVGYPVTVETLTRGRSLGKLALGLRVVREDGGPIRFRQALVRGLAGFIVDFGVFSFFTGAVGVISSLSSAKGKRVGDVLAGTVVLRERMPTPSAQPLAMPPSLAGWAAGLELSRLPDDLALAARQFVLRAGTLDPGVRASVGARLATEVAGHVSPPPPGQPPAEEYLAAVLAERRRREGARLAAAAPASGPPWPGAPPPGPGPAPPPPSPGTGPPGFAPPG